MLNVNKIIWTNAVTRMATGAYSLVLSITYGIVSCLLLVHAHNRFEFHCATITQHLAHTATCCASTFGASTQAAAAAAASARRVVVVRSLRKPKTTSRCDQRCTTKVAKWQEEPDKLDLASFTNVRQCHYLCLCNIERFIRVRRIEGKHLKC